MVLHVFQSYFQLHKSFLLLEDIHFVHGFLNNPATLIGCVTVFHTKDILFMNTSLSKRFTNEDNIVGFAKIICRTIQMEYNCIETYILWYNSYKDDYGHSITSPCSKIIH